MNRYLEQHAGCPPIVGFLADPQVQADSSTTVAAMKRSSFVLVEGVFQHIYDAGERARTVANAYDKESLSGLAAQDVHTWCVAAFEALRVRDVERCERLLSDAKKTAMALFPDLGGRAVALFLAQADAGFVAMRERGLIT